MVTTRPLKTIVKPTALGPVANTDTKLLINGLFQMGRVLAQDGVRVDPEFRATSWPSCSTLVGVTWPYGGALQNETSA